MRVFSNPDFEKYVRITIHILCLNKHTSRFLVSLIIVLISLPLAQLKK